MTDEQASLIAAAIALQGSFESSGARVDAIDDLADSIATLSRSLYLDLRDLTSEREQRDLVAALATLASRVEETR